MKFGTFRSPSQFLFLAFVLATGLSVSANALNREAFTITKYNLEAQIEPDQQRLGVRGTITLRNDSAQPQKIAALQISSSLNWRSIRVESKVVQFVSQPYSSDIDHSGALSEAIVTLPAEIKPKATVDVEIGYEGVIARDTTRLTRVGVPDQIAKHSSWDEIGASFTAVRGAGYVAWYPIATESADFSEGNSLFEVVDRWKAREAASAFKVVLHLRGIDPTAKPTLLCGADAQASSGEIDKDSGIRAQCEWKELGTATPTFVIAEYLEAIKPPLNLFSLRGHEVGASTYSNAFDPAAKFVSDWFGPPSAPLAIADFADPHSVPFESGTLLMASFAAEDSKVAGINLVHQLVHSAVPSSRPWIYEGLAHFAEAMYRQEQGGRQAALDVLGLHRAEFLDSEKQVSQTLQKQSELQNNSDLQKQSELQKEPGAKAIAPKSVGEPLSATFDETYYRSKAAYVWWMLRDMVGDDSLKQAFHKYRAEDDKDRDNDRDRDKDPKYFERLIEAAAKRDLSWFFNDWVYQDRGLPDFRVQSVHPWKTEKGVQFITLTLENTGTAGAEIPVTVMYEGGEMTKRIEVRAKSTATTRVELPGTAIQIVLNDGSVPETDLTNNTFKIPEPSD